jgi:trimeric autotransporter adhesin
VFAFACLALTQNALALNPPPDGGYPGGNTAEGNSALFSLTSGGFNTAVGYFALRSPTTANFNTGIGAGALLSNTADQNTATGAAALLSNTTGTLNTANGAFALFGNTTGFDNTATGVTALIHNIDGHDNTATGLQSLYNNTTGNLNTAIGVNALFGNTAGLENTANGVKALFSNTNGVSNTATGVYALVSNTTGSRNTAIGKSALFGNTTGGYNTAIGVEALSLNTTGDDNTAIGNHALSNSISGGSNTALGNLAGLGITTASNVIAIGTSGANLDNSCYIGNIFGAIIDPSNTLVGIDATGKLGTTPSARRFKRDIQPMENASEAILALKPVRFHYKSDNTNTPQFGLVAEEVAEVNPDLVVRDKNGEIYTVRYDAVNAMLLNEFLKQHCRVQELTSAVAIQEATIAQQGKDFKSVIAQQQEQIRALTSSLTKQSVQIEKVSAQIERRSPAEQMVLNND